MPIDFQLLSKLADEAMKERDLIPDFPSAVSEQADHLESAQSCQDELQRKDVTDKLWCSIDNDDSLDLDQLTYAEKLDDQRCKIYIAVADVDSLVKKGSPIDLRAGYNTTSVYTPAKIFHMLPEKLSTNLTSLNKNERRCAIVVEVIIEQDGSSSQFDVYPACVYNRAKLAYPSVSAWLENRAPAPQPVQEVAGLTEQLQLQDQIAQRIKQFRHQSGALTLQTVELKTTIRDGQITSLKQKQSERADQLIENFMISANVAITKFLTNKQIPTLRRVVRTPKQWDRIVAVVEENGGKIGAAPDSVALEKFLSEKAKEDPLTFPDLSLTLIKLLGKGEYVAEVPGQRPIGHFDLALRDYAHTTAPNRRYPDLIMQRLLKSHFAGTPLPYSFYELDLLARHCTRKEDDANKVERRLQKSAAALYLQSHLNEKFKGIITGASSKGTWVRIFNPPVEGRVIQGEERVNVGNKVEVKLVSVDVYNGYINFAVI